MSTKRYPHYLGVRLSDADAQHLRQLSAATGQTSSTVIRFLVRTAAKRPDAVAAGLQREGELSHEPT